MASVNVLLPREMYEGICVGGSRHGQVEIRRVHVFPDNPDSSDNPYFYTWVTAILVVSWDSKSKDVFEPYGFWMGDDVTIKEAILYIQEKLNSHVSGRV